MLIALRLRRHPTCATTQKRTRSSTWTVSSLPLCATLARSATPLNSIRCTAEIPGFELGNSEDVAMSTSSPPAAANGEFSLDAPSQSQGSRRGSEASEKMVKVAAPPKPSSRSGSMSAPEDEGDSSEEEGLTAEGWSLSLSC